MVKCYYGPVTEPGIYTCPMCKRSVEVIYANSRIIEPDCPGKPMSILERTLSFGKALWKFAEGHGEFLPQEQIQERFDICQKCPLFTGTSCQECKCGVNGQQKLMNKLAHPTQHCPLEKW